MKQRHYTAAAILFAVLLLLSACGSTVELSSDVVAPETVYRNLLSTDTVLTEDAVYFFQPIGGDSMGQPTHRRLMRLDLATDTVACPCPLTDCSHYTNGECPYVLRKSRTTPLQLFGEWIACTYAPMKSDTKGNIGKPGYVPDSHVTRIYNIETGEHRDIFPEPATGAEATDRIVRLGDKLYHILKHETWTNIEPGVYQSNVTMTDIECYDLTTGETSVILTHDFPLDLLTVGTDRIYLRETEERYYSIKADGTSIRAEETISGSGFANFFYDNMAYYDDHNTGTIVRTDFATGETFIVAEHPDLNLYFFDVEADRLYYTTTENGQALADALRAIYDAYEAETGSSYIRDYTLGKEQPIEPYTAQVREAQRAQNRAKVTLWCAELDGSNPTPILTMTGAKLGSTFRVGNGYLYTDFNCYDPTTGDAILEKKHGSPCRINLATGDVSLLEDPGTVVCRVK